MAEPETRSLLHPRRRNVLLVVAIVVAGVLLLVGTNAYLGILRERALSGDWRSAVGTMRLMLVAAAALVALSTLALGGMLWRIGSRAISGQRFPPTGCGITATRELEGDAARKIGRLLQATGIIVFLAGTVAAALAVFHFGRM